jgi:hypothetical protein
MLFCNRSFNAFQRRTMQLVGGMLGFCVALSVGPRALLEYRHLNSLTFYAIAVLATLPIVGTLIVIARYLARETDEYLRSLVVTAILWGFGVVMITDTLLGSLVEHHSMDIPFGLFNMDIFVVTAMIALRIQLWRNQ